jgi:hypothetical protein
MRVTRLITNLITSLTSSLSTGIAIVAAGVTILATPAGAAVSETPGALAGVGGDSRLSGPGVDISVAVPPGWHQVADPAHPQLLQMAYPDTCTAGLSCASAIARVISAQAPSAQNGAQTAEQGIAGQPGIQGATITSQGPVQIAGRNGYAVRFSFTTTKGHFQAETAALETGPAADGKVPVSLIFVAVSDLPGAPPATVIDEIVGSAQLVH